MPRRPYTPRRLEKLIDELGRCPVVDGVRQVPDKLVARAIDALGEFERDRQEWVTIPRAED